MGKYDWQSLLTQLYASFPEAPNRPVIGITANYVERSACLAESYYKMVACAGGVPVIIPSLEDTGVIVNTLDRLDGVVLSGGGDFNPLYCGEEPSPKLHSINGERDLPELLITRLAYNRQLPILGICKGIQTLAMALDGRVAQDLGDIISQPIKHSQDASRSEATHTVSLVEGSVLSRLYGAPTIAVNSFHHQAIADPGERFEATAIASDGIIEAIESSECRPIIGVQWHPECLADGLPLFRWLVDEASSFATARRLTSRTITIDSHCDTPMLFPQGIDFLRRDPRCLVDLHKMSEGCLDAVIMAAYLPQPSPGGKFSDKIALDISSPKSYADTIFDKIEDIVSSASDYMAIARTPEDIISNKRLGKKSVMLAIENGLALEGDIANVDHFARRGVVYITLCHNGDNDLCDSSRGSNTNNGVSPLGEQVIREMNRLGIMVDLSHASEKTFWDALAISSEPVICSHSSARVLCDHPRNLTDEQMRALATKGGVCQLTLYSGFLRSDGEADVNDFLRHLRHAVDVMGIDSVGLGSDFDGDGGVRGMADSSYFISLVRLLLREGYSYGDIEGILGGNLLRVMRQVQNCKQ